MLNKRDYTTAETSIQAAAILMSEDKEDLVQRLGITAKSVKVRFSLTTNGLLST